MSNEDSDKKVFRRVIPDLSESNESLAIQSESQSIKNAETGVVIDEPISGVVLENFFLDDLAESNTDDIKLTGNAKSNQSAGDVSLKNTQQSSSSDINLYTDESPDGASVDAHLEGGLDSAGTNVDLSINSDSAGSSTNINQTGSVSSGGNDVSLNTTKKHNVVTNVEFEAERDQLITNTKLEMDKQLMLSTKLQAEAQALKSSLDAIVEDANESYATIEKTVVEVERASKASKLPGRLAMRLEGVKSNTVNIKKTIDDLKIRKEGLTKRNKS